MLFDSVVDGWIASSKRLKVNMDQNKLFRGKFPLVFRFRWLFSLLLVIVFSSSCISFRTWYNWADTYLANEIDTLFNLTSEQDDFVDNRLDVFHEWHRKNEIPRYIAFLENIEKRTRKPLTPGDLEWFRDTFEGFYHKMVEAIADDGVLFFTTLTPKQIDHLEKQLDERNREWLEEQDYSDDSYEEEAIEERLSRYEEWLGELTESQQAFLTETMVDLRDRSQIYYEHRLRSQRRFLEILRNPGSAAEMKRKLLEWQMHPESYETEEYLKQSNIWQARTEETILYLDRTATKKQREHFNMKIADYLRTLRKTAGVD